MRILLLLGALLLVAPVVIGQSSPESSWPTYTIKGEEFSVALPTVPAMASSAMLYPRLQKFRVERHLKTLLDDVVYTVDVFENQDTNESLEDFITAQTANSGIELASGRDLSINGVRGREYTSREKTDTFQFFATERRLYRLAASGSLASNAAVQRFFSSITLSKPKNATEVVDGPGMPLVLDTGERIYKGKELDKKPRLISKLEPQYTEQARKNRVQGQVVLWAIFSKTGEVTNIYVVKGLPDGMTERCIESAKSIEFTPGIKDGQPVSMWMTLEYNFFP